MITHKLADLCPNCYRLPRGEPPFEWCVPCLSKLTDVAKEDQLEASEHHLAAVSAWRNL